MVWRTRSIEAFGAIEAARSEGELFRVLVDYAAGFGANLVSYHHLTPQRSGTRPGREDMTGRDLIEGKDLFTEGFPEVWVRDYQERNYDRIDPITSLAALQTRPVLWSDVEAHIEASEEQAAFLSALWDWLAPGDGIAVPCFGPSGRHGYVGMGSTRELDHWEGSRMRVVQSVCESFHLRFCELRLAGLPIDFELTEREAEVLRLMGRGHADWLIAAVTGATPERVAAIVDSLLAKMGVTDRPSALIRAKGLGLVG